MVPSPKGGAAIIYGKVQIVGGPGESLSVCREELMRVLKKVGYPEQEVYERDDDDDDDIEEEMEEFESELEDKKAREDEERESKLP